MRAIVGVITLVIGLLGWESVFDAIVNSVLYQSIVVKREPEGKAFDIGINL